MTRGSFGRRFWPALLALGVIVAGLATENRLAAWLGAAALVATAPIARHLATRVVVWSAGSLGMMSAVTLMGVGTVRPGLMISLVLLGFVSSVVLGLLRPTVSWVPLVPVPDAIVLLGVGLLLVMLGLPYARVGPEGVLLDLARGFDNVQHFAIVSGFVQPSPPVGDGSTVVGTGYPRGFHALVAGWIQHSDAAASLVAGYAGALLAATSVSACLLGWTAVRIAQSLGRTGGLPAGGVAGAMFGVVATMGGLITGLFEVGHVPFLAPVALVAAVGWWATSGESSASRTVGQLLLVGVAGVAVVGTYPPLVLGLAPAWLSIAARMRRYLPGPPFWFGVTLVGAGGLGMAWWWWSRSGAFVVAATGEFSTPLVTSMVGVGATCLLALAAARAGSRTAVERAVGVGGGFALASLGVAVPTMLAGYDAAANYYVAKLAQAAWIGMLPALVGLSAWALCRAFPVRAGASATWGAAALAVCLGLVLAFLPDGRYPGLGGPALLDQRIKEAERASGQVDIIAASVAAGRSRGDAAVMLEPGGWFFRVAKDEPEATDWVKSAASASYWLNALRGPRTSAQDEAARCMDESSEAAVGACLGEWLDKHPRSRIVVVGRAAELPMAWGETRNRLDGRLVHVVQR